MRRFLAGLLASTTLLIALPVLAGQVRISAGGTSFVSNDVNLNLGDHVVWVWTGGSHNVVSGIGSDFVGHPDGRFTSGAVIGLTGIGTQYSWKSSGATGDQEYYCATHVSVGMFGTLHIFPSGQPVADFRITEVQYGAASGLDRIEITNLGDAVGDLGRYRISISNTAAEQDFVPLGSVPVPVGGRVTIFTNQTGTSTATSLFMGGTGGIGDLPTTGSVALFVPYRQSTAAQPLTSNLIVDYVEWTATGQPNEAAATAAGVWPAGDFVTGEANPAYSISFCGNKTDRGAAMWQVTKINFGSAGRCTTPTRSTSWGRIKTLYR